MSVARVALSAALVACAAFGPFACGTDKPPPLADSDGSVARPDGASYGDAIALPMDAGQSTDDAGGVASSRDYDGVCISGNQPVWHFFDFQTHTPADSAIIFRAQTAASEPLLAAAPSVELAKVTGPDITVWTGVDVDSALGSIGQKSASWLRITTVLVPPTSDAGAPAVTASRQMYDCIIAQ